MFLQKRQSILTTNHLAVFLTGVGVGAAAALLLVPEAGEKLGRRLRNKARETSDYVRGGAEALRNSADDLLAQGKEAWTNAQTQGNVAMGDLREKTKDQLNDAAKTAKKAAAETGDRARDLAHTVGKTMEEGGKRLQNA